jgi:hypothetical protein
MRRDQGGVGKTGSPLPLRATSIVLALWITGLVILAFVVVPAVFATCGPAVGSPGP